MSIKCNNSNVVAVDTVTMTSTKQSNAGMLFELPRNQSYADGVSLINHMTLRNACIDYRDSNGVSWVNSIAPEMSGATSDKEVPCMNKFDNVVGHMVNNQIICFPIQLCNSPVDLIITLCSSVQQTINHGRLWSLMGTVSYTCDDGGKWTVKNRYATPEESYILNIVNEAPVSPISASTVHAVLEAHHFTNSSNYGDVFKFPHGASPSAGLIGTLHDNQCIDMSPADEKNKPNVAARAYLPEYKGFICAGHTSHSVEAGRIRRVTCDVRVRVLSDRLLDDLDELSMLLAGANSEGNPTWTLFCMGYYVGITSSEFVTILKYHKSVSTTRLTAFSVHVNADSKLITLSISSGTLLKLCSNECWADNVEVYHSSLTRSGVAPVIDTEGPDQLRACFSGFFNLVPFISSDRAPRPLISSVQTPQAVCLPWCPGTAAVSPCYTFKPMITTQMYGQVFTEIENDESNLSSYLPGENVMTLYLNLPGNYEDAMLVSKRYIDNGGFSTMSVCVYLLPLNEYVPPPGSTLCAKLSKWWKSPCQPGCKHTMDYATTTRQYVTGYVATGVVISITRLPTGNVSVRVRSHQQLQQGDKLSTGHGQKGIANILNYEDMPIARHPKHGTIVPDVVVAMSSIVTRQTNGQLYEIAASLSAMANKCNLPVIVNACDVADVGDEFTVIDGSTGMPFTTAITDDNGNIKMEPTKASMGFVRMFNQTQMTRERHHVSHITPGSRSVRTQTGRTAGGAVAWGEMEIQALSSSGLQHCNAEIVSRGDRSVCSVCVSCQRLGPLCTCTNDDNHVLTTISEDLKTLDITSYISHNTSFKYVITPEP
jgi:hypothetical protein